MIDIENFLQNFAEVKRLWNAGCDYYNGNDGTEKDYGKALKLFEKAAALGSADAENQLGWMYRNGEGVEKDLKVALRHYLYAVDLGRSDVRWQIRPVEDVLGDDAIIVYMNEADRGSKEAFLMLFAHAMKIGHTKEFFEYCSGGENQSIRNWIDQRLAPLASSANSEIKGAYANMLMFDAETFSAKDPWRAIEQLQRAFRIADEACDSGNPSFTIGSFSFHPSHVARRTAFRLTDIYYSLADYEKTVEYSFRAIDEKYNRDYFVRQHLDKVSRTLNKYYSKGDYNKAIGVFHRFFEVMIKYEQYYEVAPVDEEFEAFIDSL